VLSALRNAFKVKELRNRILFVLGMMVIYRVGSYIPVPGVDLSVYKEILFEGAGGDIFSFLDLFAGGALKNFTVFAMGISPYITASIIIQLLGGIIPYFQELQKQGPDGRKKLVQFTRYGTIILALLEAFGITMTIRAAVYNPGFFNLLLIVISLTAGTAFLMWLGELITEKGIGNGISIIIFTSIMARFPSDISRMTALVKTGEVHFLNILFFLILAVIIIAGVIFIELGERRIPVQYSKRIVGRKVYGGRSTHIPMKINQAGVIPVIFASSLLMFPAVISQLIPAKFFQTMASWLSPGQPLYIVLYAALIFFFTYFWTAFTFNPEELAENMQKYGGFIPGIRPGKATEKYLEKILVRITLAGALFLTVIALLPYLFTALTKVAISFGGTSILIMTGVALEVMRQIESHLLLRHYEGFMK